MGMFDKFPYRNTRDLNLNWIVKKIIYLEGVVGEAVSDVAKFLSKKGGKMEGAIDMQGNRIFNVPTPTTDNDVASKKYVDDNDKKYLPKSGGTLTGELNMNLNKIINVATPETFGDATTKKYVDDSDNKKLDLSGGTMTGAVNMDGNKITNAATPTADTDVATKKYVDDHSVVSGDYLPLSGGTMAGAVNMGGNKITSVATPEADTDVATKKYVDDHSGGVSGDYLPLAGGTMSGAVNMGGNKITSVATPEADTDVATKKYVDDHSGGINSVTYYANNLTIPAIRTGEKDVVVCIGLPFVIKNIPQGITKDKVSLRYYNSGNTYTTIAVNQIGLNRTGNIMRIVLKTEAALPSTNGLYVVNTANWVISSE